MALTFQELMEKADKSEVERILIQCLATIATLPTYERFTLEEIFQQQQIGANRVKF